MPSQVTRVSSDETRHRLHFRHRESSHISFKLLLDKVLSIPSAPSLEVLVLSHSLLHIVSHEHSSHSREKNFSSSEQMGGLPPLRPRWLSPMKKSNQTVDAYRSKTLPTASPGSAWCSEQIGCISTCPASAQDPAESGHLHFVAHLSGILLSTCPPVSPNGQMRWGSFRMRAASFFLVSNQLHDVTIAASQVVQRANEISEPTPLGDPSL
jgi:hypothetical protein